MGKHKIAIRLAAVSISLLLYAAMDIGVAQLCKGSCGDLFHRGHRQKFRQKDPNFHHSFVANVKVIEEWGGRAYPLYTNSLGFRDSKIREVAQKPEGQRILLAGDSFTEGSGVTWEESVAGRLESALEEKGVEVLNSAVSSYAPAVYYARIRDLIVEREYAVDHVFVLIDQSDIENSATWYRVTDDNRVVEKGDLGRAPRAFNAGASNWLKDNSLTVSFLYQLRDFLSYQFKKATVAEGYEKGSPYMDDELWKERLKSATSWCEETSDIALTWKPEVGVRFATEYMTDLARLLKDRNVGLTVVIYPWPSNVLYGKRGTRCETVWEDWAAENGVDIINLFGTYLDAGETWPTIEKYFIPYDVHWTPAGHRRTADALLAYIRDKHLFE